MWMYKCNSTHCAVAQVTENTTGDVTSLTVHRQDVMGVITLRLRSVVVPTRSCISKTSDQKVISISTNMTSLHVDPDEVILRNGSNHHTDDLVPNTHHTHHHHHHHHHHKSHHNHPHHNSGHHHHHHHRNHHNHHNHHHKHASKAEGLKTVDVDEFFEQPLPNKADDEIDPIYHDDDTKFSIPVPKVLSTESSSGLSKSLPSKIVTHNSTAMSFQNNANEILPLPTRKEVSKTVEEEEQYPHTHVVMDDISAPKEVRTQRSVSMNEAILQQNFKKPVGELHHMKPYKENSKATVKSLPKLVMPTAIPPRRRRLSKSTCRSPDSPRPNKEEEAAKTIEKYIESCNTNYEEVEQQINRAFSKLSVCLNHRRKTLIEEAKQMRDRKVKLLNEKKEKYSSGNMTRSSTVTDISELASDIECATPVNEKQSDQLEENYGIHEPWNDSSTSFAFEDHPPSEQGDSSASNSSENHNRSLRLHANYKENGLWEEHLKETSSSSSGYSTSSPPEPYGFACNDFDPHYSSLFSIDELEEGNMSFNYNSDGDLNFISNIGSLKEDLSSPQSSITKGLTDSGGIIGDRVMFSVHTKDKIGNPNSNIADKIVIRVYDCNRNKVQADELSAPSSSQQHIPLINSQGKRKTANVYNYSFIPLKPGRHEIVVKLNDIHIPTSPHNFFAYPRLNLTFTSETQMFEETKNHHFPISRSRSSSRGSQKSNSDDEEDINDNDEEEEDECHPHSMNVSDSWVIQKDGKSSLLQSLCNHPSDIYANEHVSGMCGWQLRITTACMHIKLNIGVKTRSGIPDLDEQFTCDFHLESFSQTASSLDRANHVPHHAHHRSVQRKSSTFTRLSWTFTLLMNDGVLRVICHELDQDKRVEINLKGAFPLRPYCSMIHHHNDDDVPHICPRPQLTFL